MGSRGDLGMARKIEQRRRKRTGRPTAQALSLAVLAKLRVNTDENSVKGRFFRAANLQWHWQKTSAAARTIAHSQTSFGTYFECVADAKSAGYLEWIAPGRLAAMSFSHQPLTGVTMVSPRTREPDARRTTKRSSRLRIHSAKAAAVATSTKVLAMRRTGIR